MKSGQQRTAASTRSGANARFPRSLGFQPAVSPTSSRQTAGETRSVGRSRRLRIGNPRYSRLEVCATGWLLASLALLTGCAVGPNYERPTAVAAMPAAFTGATNEWKLATPQAHLPKGAWWEVFSDTELNQLEAQAAEANQELKAAVARFAQARAAADVARSGLFPRIGAGFTAVRQSDSANKPQSGTGQASGKSFTSDNFIVPFDLSYEVDLWGCVRRQVESARAKEQADAADLEGVRLAIAAEVAADYFTLHALDAERSALVATIEANRKSLDLTRNRRAGGLVSDLDVAQAETVLKTAEAQLPTITLARTRFEHALAALTGQPASGFSLAERPLDQEPVAIPADLPSALLEGRPDIAAAERRMAAANVNIGVSKAAYYPTIRFNGLAGFQSLDAGTLFDWPSRFWAVGPSLSLPLFEGGKRRATVLQAEASYEETIARYRDTVLTAFAEVEDQLAAQRLLAEGYAQEASALQSARRQFEIATNRYRSGLVTYLQVVVAQNAVMERERAVARLRGQQYAAAVALVKALGGGWEGLAQDRAELSAKPKP
ncbi:MAG: efflux transporter outer membrane subunit [Verrucomicrobia bacterium]|nr:efflux transporter outer membrane subunit [Verrucomicrobiota bacterium]